MKQQYFLGEQILGIKIVIETVVTVDCCRSVFHREGCNFFCGLCGGNLLMLSWFYV